MSGKFSRNKGQRGEREVIKLLQPIVDKVSLELGLDPPPLERNLLQAHKGGADVHGLDWLALEVKFQEKENVDSWWAQCVMQASPRQEPMLFYRRAYVREWRIKMYGYLLIEDKTRVRCPVIVSERAALTYFESRIRHELMLLTR